MPQTAAEHAQPEKKEPSILKDLLLYQTLFKKAEGLYKEDEQKCMDHFKEKDKDGKYYHTMIKKGTANDRASALQMLIRKAPGRSLSLI